MHYHHGNYLAFRFVFIMGIVNFFSDMTYEGASSINGPFLGTLGASALAIGIISGIGEFLGYSLRFISGYIGDRSDKYWLITFIGYIINLCAVPALALADHWLVAAGLIIAERVGRAIRKPTVEAMLSYTTGSLGRGWVYGLNTALDQLGATLGPLLMAFVLFKTHNYTLAYTVLIIPTLLALLTLTLARLNFSNPSHLEAGPTATLVGFGKAYWLYMLGGACVAAGLISFELISYHYFLKGVFSEMTIPVLFSLAMATDALASLFFGRLFDQKGFSAVLIAFSLSAFFAPFVFFGNAFYACIGMVLWGIGFGAQDTLLKAIIAGILPEGKRNLAFGLFYTGYGAGWLVGSITTGLLYSYSLPLLVLFSVAMQLISLPFFIFGKKSEALI